MKTPVEHYAEIVAEKKLKFPHAYTLTSHGCLVPTVSNEYVDILGECPVAELAFLRTTTAGDLAASCETNAKLAREIEEHNARWNRHLNCVAAKDVQIKELNDQLIGAREGMKLWKERAQSGENVAALNEQLRELKETVKLHETRADQYEKALSMQAELIERAKKRLLAFVLEGQDTNGLLEIVDAVIERLQSAEALAEKRLADVRQSLREGNRTALVDLASRAFENSKAHGFWGSDSALDDLRTIPAKLMLIVSEVSEALEEFRNHDASFSGGLEQPWFMWRGNLTKDAEVNGKPAKPVGFASEIADVLIRVFDLAGALGIDLDAAVSAKMKYNESRPFKHGKVI